tara:strand:- start:4825 stop:5364 length:540 start_codon:yes stop_codon:yes gene_type:complete
MNRLKISHDTKAEAQHKKNSELKLIIWGLLVDLVSEHLEIKDEVKFIEAPLEYIIEQMDKNTVNDFPPKVSITKRLEMLEFPLDKVKELINDFNTVDTEVDLINLKAIDLDFAVYLTDKQEIARYELMTELIKPITKLREQGLQVNYGQIINGLNGAAEYDFSKAELFPSMRYVRQDYR